MSPAVKGGLSAAAFFIVPVATSIGIVFAVDALLERSPRLQRERAACDRYVAVLLNSDDPTEITRAGLLVRQMDCSIGRRLKP